MTRVLLKTGQGGREGENPDAASPSEAMPRNSSGSASVAASLLDLRQHCMAFHELFEAFAANGILTDEQILPLRRLRQRGFRRGR